MSTFTPSRPRVRVFRVGHEYALLVVLCQNVLVGPMMGDDDVDDVGDDVLSCPGRYYGSGRPSARRESRPRDPAPGSHGA